MLVYHVNKRALINIATTVGKTDNIHLKDIVKQVTRYCPKLCFVATDKVNLVKENSFHMMKGLEIKNFIHIHDIDGCGNKNGIVKLAKCLQNMQEEKKFKVEKTAYMIVRTSSKEKEEIKITLRKEKITINEINRLEDPYCIESRS